MYRNLKPEQETVRFEGSTHLIHCCATCSHRELEDGKCRGEVNSGAGGVVRFKQAD